MTKKFIISIAIGIFSIIFLVVLFGCIIVIVDNINRPKTSRKIATETLYRKEDIDLAMDVVQKKVPKEYNSSIIELIYNESATIDEQNHYGDKLFNSNENEDLIVIDAVLKKKIYNPFSKVSSEYTISFLLKKENDGWTIVNEGKRA